jgi:CheY-like chemotaxis protein
MVSVLFVDNDATIAWLGAQLLEGSGFAVTIARDSLEAMSIVADVAEIGIAILDYDMPFMNGCALARRLRSLNPGLKIILYSGAIDIPQSDMSNVDVFISKGDGMCRLLAQVHEFAQSDRGFENRVMTEGPPPDPVDAEKASKTSPAA